MALKRFKQHIKKREAHKIPRGFTRNDDGTVSINHNTSNAARRKKKKVNESLLKNIIAKAGDKKTFDEHAKEHNKDSAEKNHEHLTKHSEDAHKDPHEAKSIQHFKQGSMNMNHHLIDHHKRYGEEKQAGPAYHPYNAKQHKEDGDRHMEEDYFTDAHVHHTILKHAKPLGKNITLYHGTWHDFGKAAKKSKDGVVHSPAHLSTTHDHKIAKNFGGGDEGDDHHHMVVIHAKKKDKGVYMDGESPKGGGERETVIPAGTKLKHIKSHKTKDGYHLHHFHIHHQENHKPYDED